MRAAFYGDDFTGSVDALLQFARRGWTGRLFVGLPTAASLERAAAEADVVGIAGIARSLPTAELEREVRPVLEALVALGPQFLQYKACSTADSSPTIGSIGRVLEIGREVVGAQTVPLVFAQPDFGRYTLHRRALRRRGRDRLSPRSAADDVDPPVDADDRTRSALHFAKQTELPIGSYSVHGIRRRPRRPAASIGCRGRGARRRDRRAPRVDRARSDQPRERPVFAIGSGGLSSRWRSPRPGGAASVSARRSRDRRVSGPVLALSGSRSSQTRRQMDAAAAAGWFVQPLELEPSRAAAQLDWVRRALRAGQSVGLTSDDADLYAAPGRLEAIADAAAWRRGAAAAAPPADHRVRRRHVEPGHPSARRRVAVDRREPRGATSCC